MDAPFAKYIPSVFVVCSPFQALCAVATIQQLEIKEYKFIVINGKDDPRRKQLINLLKSFHIVYKENVVKKINMWICRLTSMKRHKKGYKRLFIGDYRNNVELYYGARYICDNGHVVYLDDGAATVTLLNNESEYNPKNKEKIFIEMLAHRRCFTLYKNFLTIYSGIPNIKYNIKELSLNKIISQQNDLLQKDIVVVGTNARKYCKPKNIPENLLIAKQKELMKELVCKYPKEHIIYIPHGRDKSEYAQQFCDEYGCEFRKTESTIEFELLNQTYAPKVIYGFTSSALYNLKKIYPSTRIVNVLFVPQDKENISYIAYYKLSEYYQKNGIELIKVQL